MSQLRARQWQAVADFAQERLAGTFGFPVSATMPALHPFRDVVAVCAEVRQSLLEPAKSVIALVEAGRVELLREGWLPAWSPDGSRLAHADATGVQVGELHRDVTGAVERLTWSKDGRCLLLVVAEPRSELAGVAGSGLVAAADDEVWTPSVASTLEHPRWRRLVLLDTQTGGLRALDRPDLNVWNACWAGDQVFAVCSAGDPTESAWYTADLRLLDLDSGIERVVAQPGTQVGAVAASPSGRRLAYVESVCSDRDLVAGDLKLLDLDTGVTVRLGSPTDVSEVAFVSEDELGFAGLVGLSTRIGFVTVTGEQRVAWESQTSSTTGVHPSASFSGSRFASIRGGFHEAPEVVLASNEESCSTAPLFPEAARSAVEGVGRCRVHTWSAPDGLEIEGWLHLPTSPGPHPLVVVVHGGPVYSHRSAWAPTGLLRPLLLARGYAVLLPNPRGSIGRGQGFARAVVGDMGGADASDVISGVTSLVDEGLVDPARVGVTGGSYGGFMSAWLVTQTDFFAAAVSQHPITDWVHQHGTCNIPHWDELFLDGKPYSRDGQYVERSPITHADRVTTPTLFIAGTLDRATPPGQALAMQRALAAHGVPSECVTYPCAGHGARDMPSVIDVTARTVEWFERWMPASRPEGESQ